MSGLEAKKLIARLLRQTLEDGSKVELDGLGTFVPGSSNGFRFIAQTKPRVFIAYVEHSEIAAIMEIPEGTSRKWLFEAKRDLKRLLTEVRS